MANLLGLLTLQTRVEALERRVRAQQAVVQTLCERLGVDPQDIDPGAGLDAEERRLVGEGKKIEAMKHHRLRTGSTLSEARDAVEGRGTH